MKDVVLVGGGHSHVQVLRRQLMAPLPDARLTVVLDRSVAIYSGMVPGFVSGQYKRHELAIDVRPLARRSGARVVLAAATGVDTDKRRILLAGRPPIHYDLASLNVGSTVAGLDTPGVREFAVPTRPIADLIDRFDGWFQSAVGEQPVVVVGGGAGGVELAFCLRSRLARAGASPPITLLSAQAPLQGRPALSERIRADAAARGITIRQGRAAAVEADAVVLEGGERLPSGLTVWVTGAAAPAWLAGTGLPVDGRGFVRVRDTLEVEGRDGLFAVGDCAVPAGWPEIPKAGVYAVREGPYLADNLERRLTGRALTTYTPQRDFLTLLNYGDGSAAGAKWGRAFAGPSVFRWKDSIDRRFMEKFQVLGPEGAPEHAFTKGMPEMAEMEMVCGGCAAKVGQTPLTAALARLPAAPADETVALGLEEVDDVVAVRRGGELLVQNVDAFTAFVDDPWLVGRVAALNAMSDLFAKGCEPRYAMAVVNIPEDEEPEEALFQVLSGARVALDEAGVTLLGGHTTVGPKLTVGFAITGFSPDGALWAAGDLRPGDALVLTRGLGTGVLFHADMAGLARGPWMDAALARMVRGNGPASHLVRGLMDSGVSAVTDVTGFGMAGHLLEMVKASGVSAEITLADVPLLPGVSALLHSGQRSTFHDQNRSVLKVIRVESGAQTPSLEALFDPQTSGGLLVGVAAEGADALVAALREGGEVDTAVIGRVLEADGVLLTVR